MDATVENLVLVVNHASDPPFAVAPFPVGATPQEAHPSFFPGDAANDATNANKAANANNADGEVAGGVRCAIAPSAGDTGAEGADELRPGSRWRPKGRREAEEGW